MSDTFNGYHVWLGIPPNEQPPNHYRLLGISAFESDLDVIDHAADRQMAHVRTFQSGRHGPLSQQILNELAAARLCLLSVDKKSDYDEQLRGRLSTSVASPILVAKPLPVARPVARPGAMSQGAPTSVAPAAQSASPVVRPKFVEPAARVAAPNVVVPKIQDETALDMDSPSSFASDASMQIRVKRRRYKRDNSWQNAALVGTLAGVVVIIGVVLFYSLRGLDWNQVLQGSFGQPPVNESTAAPQAEPPVAPPPPGQN